MDLNPRTAQKEVACTPFPMHTSLPTKNDKGIYSVAARTNLVALTALADCDYLGIAKGDLVYVAVENANAGWGRQKMTITPDIGEFIMVPAEQVRLVQPPPTVVQSQPV